MHRTSNPTLKMHSANGDMNADFVNGTALSGGKIRVDLT